MIMTHTWKVLLFILKWALNVTSLYIGTSLLTKPTNLWLNRLTDGWCNAAARTTSILVGELVLPQANNCINLGGSSKASTRKGCARCRFFRHLFMYISFHADYTTCSFWWKLRELEIIISDGTSMVLFEREVLIGYTTSHTHSILPVEIPSILG